MLVIYTKTQRSVPLVAAMIPSFAQSHQRHELIYFLPVFTLRNVYRAIGNPLNILGYTIKVAFV